MEGVEPEGEESATRYKDGTRKNRPADLDAVLARTRQLSLPDTDAEAIWNKWLGNGFTNDRKPMKDWRAVIRSWQLNGYLPSQRQRNGHGLNGHPSPHGKPQEQRDYSDTKL